MGEKSSVTTPEGRFLAIFGRMSEQYQKIISLLSELWDDYTSQYASIFNDWFNLLEDTNGYQNRTKKLFLQHTYLGILCYLLAKAFTAYSSTQASVLLEQLFLTHPHSWLIELSRQDKRALSVIQALDSYINSFDLHKFSFDVLKWLYEDLVSPATRHDLGEYYTPDWLVEWMLNDIGTLENLKNKVFLDPSCGSGTFIFHLIRYKLNNGESPIRIFNHVIGFDIHPLAVLVCRVNYLLAFGERIKELDFSRVQLPIYQLNVIHPKKQEKEIFSLYCEKIDFVIGNPPWVVLRSIPSKNYQDHIKKLVKQLNFLIKPQLITQIDISALFLVLCAKYFLKPHGKIYFVLPHSLFDGDHYHAIRIQQTRPSIKILKIVDLKEVNPLFTIPACLFLGKKSYHHNYNDISGITDLNPIFSEKLIVNLPKRDISLEEALLHINVIPQRLYVNTFGVQSSRLSNAPIKLKSYHQRSYYYPYFRQGASIVPMAFYFVDVGKYKKVRETYLINVKTTQQRKFKKPWDTIKLNAPIEAEFLYAIISSSELKPFSIRLPLPLAVLPLIKKEKHFQIITAAEASKFGYPFLSKWLSQCEVLWKSHKKETIHDSIYEWLDYQGKLTSHPINPRYLVVYNASGKRCYAAVVNVESIIDHMSRTYQLPKKLNGIISYTKCYYYSTSNKDEAYYLSAILNSNFLNQLVMPLTSQRDLHKKPLEIAIPRFDSSDLNHRTLSNLGKKCETVIEQHRNIKSSKKILHLLQNELKEIDTYVKRIFD